MRTAAWRLLSMLVALCVARGVGADPPRIPQPISASELGRFGDILRVSSDQRLAIEREYDAYLDAFEPLRIEMIEVAVRHPRFGRRPEEFPKHVRGFVERTGALDQAFFAQIALLLTEPQRELLPRVRGLRERSMLRKLDLLGQFIGEGVPEMRELLESLDPPPRVLAELSPSLEAYEQQLSIALRGLLDAGVRLCADGAVGAANQVVERVRTLRAMNRRLFDELAPRLPDDLRGRWRDEWLARAYDGGGNARMGSLAYLAAALETPLDAAERESLLDLQLRAQRVNESALLKLMNMFDGEAIRHAPQGGAVSSPGYREAVAAIRDEVAERDREFRKELDTILGKERVGALKPTFGRAPRGMLSLRLACGVVSYAAQPRSRAIQISVPGWRSDALMPQPMSLALFTDLIAALGLDEARRAAALEQFQEIDRRLQETLGPLRDEALRNSMHVLAHAREGRDPLDRAKASQRVRASMRQSIEAAEWQQLASLRDIAGIDVGHPVWTRIIRLRERDVVRLDLMSGSGDQPNCSPNVDLVHLLLQLKLDGAAWEHVATVADEYETQALARLRALHDAHSNHSFRELARRDGATEIPVSRIVDNEELHQLYRALGELNRDTLSRMREALSDFELAARLQHIYNQTAFPLAFYDPGDMAPALARAAAMPSLAPDQRARIAELQLAFDDAMAATTSELVRLCESIPPDLPMVGMTITPERGGNRERFSLEFAHLSDDRDDANRRALRGLRTTLAPAQLREAGLPQFE